MPDDPVIDPTANVIALNEAANRRQDDLRQETNRRIDTEIICLKDMAKLRADHVKEISDMRAAHQEKMALAESARLDSIRKVDVDAVATAAERSAAQAAVLAAQVQASRETLQALVTSTAATVAAQSTQQFNTLGERVTILERSQNLSAGRTGYSDPMRMVMVAVAASAASGFIVFVIQRALAN